MKRFITRKFLVLLVLFVTLSISGFARDWWKNPATVYIKHAPRVVAVGDVHGGFPQMADTLETLKIARRDAHDPMVLHWCGGNTVLLFIGDLVDRGLFAKDVMDQVNSLQKQAPTTGGRVITLIGNHEIMLLNGTVKARAAEPGHKEQVGSQMTIDSFRNGGLDFDQVVSPQGRYGKWIRTWPMYAIVNGYLFVHAGLSDQKTTAKKILEQFRAGIESNTWDQGIFVDKRGPFWNRGWWKKPDLVKYWRREFQVDGFVFGHTIGALGNAGLIDIQGKEVISIDIGMTPMYANSNGGALLITTRPDGNMYFRARYPDQPERLLFTVPAPKEAASTADPDIRNSYPVPAQAGSAQN
jgi:hypothetical protein